MTAALSPDIDQQVRDAEVELETPETRAAIERAERKAREDVREELVYQSGGVGYYRDLALAEKSNRGALDRLERHGRQMDEAAKHREIRTLEGTEFEYRVNPSLTAGQGGEFAPPIWLNELFSSIPRSSECVQRLAQQFDLPEGAASVNIPRMTQGTQTATQVANAAVADRDATTTPTKSPATTFAGMSDWSLQVLEMSPVGAALDWVVQKDLAESLDSKVEDVLLSGSGENEQFYGMLKLPETTGVEVSGTEATAVIAGLGKAVAANGLKRRKPPEALLMSTARFAYLNFSPDTERQQVFTDIVGREFPIASLGGFAVYLNDAIKAELGTAKEQDTIIACRPSDFIVFYSEPKPVVHLEPLSGTLTARFRLHRYVAAVLGRYPAGIAYLFGAGMIPPAGYH